MPKLNLNWMAGAALVGTLLAGCGGNSSDTQAPPGPPPPPPPPMQQTITNVADYVRNLFASADKNSEPIDINGLTLVPNDQTQPAAVN